MGLKLLFNTLNFDYVPKNEIYSRIKSIQNILQVKNLDVLIITSKVNNYYFTGTNQEQILIIPANDPPTLFVKRDLERAKIESPLNIRNFKGFKDILSVIGSNKKIGLEYNYLTVKEFFKLQEIFGSNTTDISRDISLLRAVKSEWEIKTTKKAAAIAETTYTEAANYLKSGIREIEFGSILFSIAQKNGHEGFLRSASSHFEPVSWHILSGISGCIHGQYDAPASGLGLSPAFPNSASNKKIEPNEPIMVDFGISYMGYQVDTTRMYSIGEPDEKFYQIFQKAEKLQEVALRELTPGKPVKTAFQKSIEKAEELNILGNFLGIGKNRKKFIGHGIGLETTEYPIIAESFEDIVQENMLIAIEPKIVIENFGIIGIENTNLVSRDSTTSITNFLNNIIKVR